jgi:hypothetical protein
MSFADLAESCESSIKKLAGCASRIDAAGEDSGAVKNVNNEATRFIRDAQGFITKMEAEVKVAAPSQRRELVEQLAQLKASMQTARSSLQRANDGKARAALLKPADKAKLINEAAHDKLESAANKSSASTMRLQQAQQQLAETADVGVKCVQRQTHGWKSSSSSPTSQHLLLLTPSAPRQCNGYPDSTARVVAEIN